MNELVCPSCGEPVTEADLFCESCGHALDAVAVPAAPRSAQRGGTGMAITEQTAARPCGSCAAPAAAIDPEGYCDQCGMRQARASDHLETDFGPAGAAVSDRGLRHHRNEDAYALWADGDRVAIVVCDGVSSTANPDLASVAATKAAMDTIEEGLGDGAAWPGSQAVSELLGEAITRAQKAVAGVAPVEPGGYAALPSTTIVAAVVAPGAVVVANIGDSRAYWLESTPGASRQLSLDDSWAEGAIAAGMPHDEAYAAPAAHIITQWLGADSAELHVHSASIEVATPGTIVVCSDGLWNYFESAQQLADLVGSVRTPIEAAAGGAGGAAAEAAEVGAAGAAAEAAAAEGTAGKPGAVGAVGESVENGAADAAGSAGVAGAAASPVAIARRLVDAALESGGHDNITVAVIAGRPARQITTEPQQ